MCTTTLLSILSSILWITWSQKELTRCANWNECQFDVIDTNFIECSAYIGCQKAKILAKGKTAEIDCSGSYSCNEAKSLKSGYLIKCGGFKSCSSISPIEANIIQCSGSSSCFCDKSKVITLKAQDSLYCSGYGSCENCKLSTGSKANCEGAASCSDTSISSTEAISCSGTNSCASTSLMTLDAVECDGGGSCQRSKIKAKKASFKGDKSCKGCTVNADQVIAEGFESLEGAEIDSLTIRRMKVEISGETSTTDTTVVCRDGSECDILCIDQCNNLEVISMTGTKTTVSITTTMMDTTTNTSITTVISCKSTNTNVGCPNIFNSNSSCLDAYFEKYLSEKREKIRLKQLYQDDEDDDDDDELYEMRIPEIAEMDGIRADVNECVDEGECRGHILTELHQECYGFESCQYATIKQPEGAHSGYVECFGDSSCEFGHISAVSGGIFCDGRNACSNATKLNGDIIQCAGSYSCAFIQGIINVNTSISCQGKGSCINNNIEGGEVIHCVANDACFNTEISSNKLILCSAKRSCLQSHLSSKKSVKCTATESCSFSTIIADKEVYIDGARAASDSVIYSPKIEASGYESFAGSTIDSMGLQQLSVKSYGDLSGNGAKIICRSGSTCSLICKSNGCKNLQYICFKGAKCYVKPRKCKMNNFDVIRGIDCPIISKIISNDDELEELVYSGYSHKTHIIINSMYFLYGGIGVFICLLIIFYICYGGNKEAKYETI